MMNVHSDENEARRYYAEYDKDAPGEFKLHRIESKRYEMPVR